VAVALELTEPAGAAPVRILLRTSSDDRKHQGRLAVRITPVLSPSAASLPHDSVADDVERHPGVLRKECRDLLDG